MKVTMATAESTVSIADSLPAPGGSVNNAIIERLQQAARQKGKLEILEAGCGKKWPFGKDARYSITGVDTDPAALEYRRAERGDLDKAILGDIRDVRLVRKKFDVVTCLFVLEHVEGVERALKNMADWLKPGGLLVLTFPNRDSVFGFFARNTPLWVHVSYARWIKGNKSAGKLGCGPYPTVYDKILSRPAFLDFVSGHGLSVVEERVFGREPRLMMIFMKIIEILSLGRLSANKLSLMYVLKKGNL